MTPSNRQNHAPGWVHREIDWLLELGNLSPEDDAFLIRISKKANLSDLSSEEFLRLVEIQCNFADDFGGET